MKVLLIILAILIGPVLLIGALLLFGKAKIRIVFREHLKVFISVFGIRYTLLSPKKTQKQQGKTQSLSRAPRSDRALRREWKKQRKRAKNAAEAQARKRIKAVRRRFARLRKKQEKLQAAKDAHALPSPNLKENLEMILSLLKTVTSLTRKKFHIRVRRMHLLVATDNAADTAILYGVIVQSAAYLLQWINNNAIPIHRKRDSMTVSPDYLSEKSRIDIDITCSLHLRDAIVIAWKGIAAFREERLLATKKAVIRQRKAKQNAKAN